ncbi:MAG: multicopper oxidase domain-containing protein [Gemmatimonadota bacterium]|nr:multicopper oxidase domain-containing protein [Gemmatimonadota bacterium]
MPHLLALLVAISSLLVSPSTRHLSSTIEPNDNRHAAGALNNRVLTIRLEARPGTWYPEGPAGRGLDVAAWAEEGQPMLNPGPLIRVPVGTEVRATLRNTLARRLTVFGFGNKRGYADSVMIEPGAQRDVHFTATTPGTFYYAARSKLGLFDSRIGDDSQLNGAIVVDGSAPTVSTRFNDRIFLISWWFTFDSTSKTGLGRATMAMNGLSWPHTERIDLVQGDSQRWRIINLTDSDHPMHLHGFYFRMESMGNGVRDTIYSSKQRRLGVTEIINPRQTMSFAWAPTRPGNWIYHCHFAGHLSHLTSLDTERGEQEASALAHHGSDRPHQMYGLVLGIRVAPRGAQVADGREPRPLRLVMREKPKVYGEHTGYAFVLGGSVDASPADAMRVPGPAIVLQRGERVAINLVNQTHDRAAVHWHGIELESYPDGVPDWSGHDKEILPSVAPGDSITVRFSAPRAGTFMYHSHFNEDEQISSGLYGPIIVLDSGKTFDPATDRVLLFSSAGTTENVIAGPWAPTLLNGEAQPAAIDLRAGVTYRFRLIDITSDVNTVVALLDGKTPVRWRAIAKDGATLPAWQATMRPAKLLFDPGEIYDFEFTPKSAGELTLMFGGADAPPEFRLPKKVMVPVHVH